MARTERTLPALSGAQNATRPSDWQIWRSSGGVAARIAGKRSGRSPARAPGALAIAR
jgi:hypothetical protein